MGYSALALHYMAVNEESGHKQFCGYGAGADCYCGKYNVDAGHKRNCSYADPDGEGECNCGKDGPVPVYEAPEPVVPATPTDPDDDLPF